MSLFRRKRKKDPRPRCAAVIPAAGQALRMGGGGKALREIAGLPVIGHTLIALDSCDEIDEIVVTARSEDIIPIADLAKKLGLQKVKKIIRGGETRTHSVLNGLLEISEDCAVVAIHDGARPCVSPALCRTVIQKAAETGAAAPGLFLTDTVKQLDDAGRIARTLDRASLAAVQTPQCFEPGFIKGALTKALHMNLPLTDDCAAAEALGMPVSMVPGESTNIKVTMPEDVLLAEAILMRMQAEEGNRQEIFSLLTGE